jgi:hypothetical protein
VSGEIHNSRELSALALVGAFGAFGALQLAAFYNAGGPFEYPLDDVYIHLAVAEQIAQGNYGVNPGEVSSPASSILYPFLLLPVAGLETQRLMPLLLNSFGLVLAAVYWARLIAVSAIAPRILALALAFLGPIVFNHAGLAFAGMEHTLHLSFSLMLVYGFLSYLRDNTISMDLWLGIPLVVLTRFEGLGLALSITAIIALRGHWRAAIWLLVLAIGPMAAFVAGLMSQGLDPLPSSVQLKLHADTRVVEGSGFVGDILAMLRRNVQQPGSLVLGASMAMLLVAWPFSTKFRTSGFRWLPLVALAAGTAHFLLGRFGWMNRYEIYVVSVVVAILVLVAGTSRFAPVRLTVLPPVVLGVLFYVPDMLGYYTLSPRAVTLQSAQIARLAQDHIKAPVAVNDIGRVAWGNQDYVLDLAGLAADEVREIRQSRPENGWAGPLVAARDVAAVMIYESWFPRGIDPSWTKMGILHLEGSRGALGDSSVTVFAPTPALIDPLLVNLGDWSRGLPNGSRFEFEEAFQ